MGYVADVFDEARLSRLPGRTAIGHVRYSTAGASLLANAQPLVFATGRGPLALAHNGNLVNAREIRASLEAKGALFTTTSDSEVILHLVARSQAPTLTGAIAEALLRGSRRLLARHPLARGHFRRARPERHPAALARRPRGLAGRRVGDLRLRPDRRQVRAGRRAGRDRPALARGLLLAPVRLSDLDALRLRARLLRAARLHGLRPQRRRVAPGIRPPAGAGAPGARPTSSSPVPDSGMYAALGYAEESGIPFALGLVRNHYVGRTFIEPKQSIRHFGVKVKLNPVREVVEGKRVVLVDDSIVRGTTSRKIVRMLREAGRAGGPRPRLLAADHEHLPLRHRHADALRADRGQPVRRGDPQVHRGGHPGLPLGRGHARGVRPAAAGDLHGLLHGHLSRSRSRKRSARKSTRSTRSRPGRDGAERAPSARHHDRLPRRDTHRRDGRAAASELASRRLRRAHRLRRDGDPGGARGAARRNAGHHRRPASGSFPA